MEWFHKLKEELKEQIVGKLPSDYEVDETKLWDTIDETIIETGKEKPIPLQVKRRLRQEIFDSLRRLDVLSEALEDESVTEIMVNGPDRIFVERGGRLELFPKHFDSREKLEDVIQQIVSRVNRRVNDATPIADARLANGDRVNVVLYPVALNGPILTIRRFPKKTITMERLIQWNAITEEAAAYLKVLVESGYNIFISGGTGSGKTTFLGALCGYIPTDQRVITIEDSAELKLPWLPNLVQMEARAASVEGQYGITIRDLFKAALRQRPDRVILGEVRSGEAMDMIQVMNSGHDGSISTGHANSARDMLYRIETMALMGMDMPLMAIRRQICSAVDILVHLGRLRDRSRRVLSIEEITGIQEGEIQTHVLFRFQEEGEEHGKISGKLMWTGESLQFRDKLEQAGTQLPELFL